MPSPRTPSRVTIPCRSRRSSASARRSGRSAKRRSVSDHRPWVAVIAAARVREKRRERRAPQPPQDVRIAPLALSAARPQLPADELLRPLQLVEQRLDIAAEALVRLGRGERAAALRVAQDELPQRLGPALEEDLRETAGRHRTQSVAVAARVLGGDETLLARH